MLADLFGVESTSGITGDAVATDCNTYANNPPRGITGFVGIQNQGATCYLNSLIQTLLFTPEFRDGILKLNSNDLGREGTSERRTILFEIRKLFSQMLLLDQKVISTVELTDSFGWCNSEELLQHDVQELNQILFSAIEESLVGTSQCDIVNSLYRGSVVNQITCSECSYVSEKSEHFLDMTVAVSGYKSLEESLADCYINCEELCGDNKYMCSRCAKLVNATKGAKIRSLPPILTVCLMRLTFDFQRMEKKKETGNYRFPLTICMSEFLEKPDTIQSSEYELFSVITHRGSANGGHYSAYIRDINNLGNWQKEQCEKGEATIKLPSKKTVLDYETPQELLHALIKAHAPHGGIINVDKLSQILVSETGVTWNKRFKSRHGPIIKFLARNDDLFLVDLNSRTVQLIENVVPDSETVADQLKEDSSEDHWFHFDDCRVQPIKIEVLQKQFGGKECAYMLYYRQKSLVTHPEAFCNPAYGVPAEIVDEITRRNEELQEQREKAEVELNTIELKLHPPSAYRIENRFIIPKAEDESNTLLIFIDQRKTVSELMVLLYEKLTCEETGGAELYAVNSTAGVLYPFRNLSALSDEETKVSAICSAGMHLLLISQEVMKRKHVYFGEEHTPLMISLNYGQQYLVETVSQSMTVQELSTLVTSRLHLTDMVKLYHECSDGECTLLKVSHEQTLADCGIKTGDTVSMHELMDERTKSDVQSVNIKIQGELNGVNLKNVSILFSEKKTIKELRKEITRLVSSEVCSFQLKWNNLPLYDDLSIASSRLCNGDLLTVEEGEPICSHQLILTFVAVRGDNSKSECKEVIVSKTCKISKCITEMKKKASIKPESDYYLRTVDWDGYPANILCDVSMSVTDAGLNHGDSVLLCEGQPKEMGSLTLDIYLDQTNELNMEYDEWVNFISKERMWNGFSERVVKMDVMDVDSCITLEELKTRILSSEVIPADVSLPQLGIQEIRDGKSNVILKGQNKTLKDGDRLMVQLLPPHDLQPSDLLLYIRLMTEGGDYGPAEAVTIDTHSITTLAQLIGRISDQLDINPDMVALAKYDCSAYQWIILDQTVTHTGKKSQIGLRKHPYNLKDLDLLGCKVALCPQSVKAQHFDTKADIQARKLLAENRQASRSADICSSELKVKQVNREVGLSIKVANFHKPA